jgi:glycosyltransferase involved in cell wall biosynthesis
LTGKMDICHIITGLNDGGAEAALFRLCTHDAGNRHHVVSLMDGGKYGPLLEAAGVRVTTLDMPRGKVTPSGLWRLWRRLRRDRPDVVQTWMYHADLLGGLAARLAGIANVNWGIRHTMLIPGTSSAGTILVAKICGRLSRLVPRNIICCARKAIEVHAGLGYDAGRMHVIPNGYDLSLYRPDREAGRAVRSALALPEQAKVIGLVARFDPLKDHDNLLGALALLKQRGKCPHCLLIGTGLDAQNDGLVARLRDLDLMDRVLLLGRRTDIPAVMNALDLHVMSSRSEAFPNVLAEAMACGTPCVSTNVGDAAAIVGDSGWIVPPEDSRVLADAIDGALAMMDEPDWAARKTAAREHVEANFSIVRMVDNYRHIWLGGATS